ncbi:hypothetical protein [Brucella endophytica]|nr:hypothetical protein [Brucella endophytica]
MVFLLFILSMAYSVVISFIQVQDEEYIGAILRYSFMIPYVTIFALVINDARSLNLAIKVLVLWVAISSITILAQTLTGPVSWFAAPAERSGSIRYASLAGSLTIIGVVGGIALPLAFCLFRTSLLQRSLLIGIIAAGMLASLQKASIINLVICLVAVLVYYAYVLVRGDKREILLETRALLGIVSVFLFISVPFYFIPPKSGAVFASSIGVGQEVETSISAGEDRVYLPPMKVAFDSIYAKAESGTRRAKEMLISLYDGTPSTPPQQNSQSAQPMSDIDPSNTKSVTAEGESKANKPIFAGDVSIGQSIHDRFFQLPGKLFEKYGTRSMLVGVGLVGGAGSLGFLASICPPNGIDACTYKYPMAHNGLVELIAMGGVPLLLSFLLVCGLSVVRLTAFTLNGGGGAERTGVLFALLLLLINIPMTSAVIMQPYIAGFLYALSLPVILRPQIFKP